MGLTSEVGSRLIGLIKATKAPVVLGESLAMPICTEVVQVPDLDQDQVRLTAVWTVSSLLMN